MAECLCRICGSTGSGRLTNIFGTTGKEFKLADKIHFHLPIRVHETDELPLDVCVACVKALKASEDLYLTSLNTDMRLREALLEGNTFKFCTTEVICHDRGKRSKVLEEAIKDAGISDSTESILHQGLSVTSESRIKCSTVQAETVKTTAPRKSSSQITLQKLNGSDDTRNNADEPESDDQESDRFVDDGEEGIRNSAASSESESENDEQDEKKCDLCEEVFEESSDLSSHRKTHSAEERLKCQECGKVFPNDGSYQSHTKIHALTPVQCEVCGKVLSGEIYLKRHMIVHEDPKFCCQICGKTARNIHKLKDHMRVHSDERPFSCGTCGQRFKAKMTCRQHEAIHSDTPSHVCEICGRAFHRKNHLDRHREVHASGKAQVRRSKLSCDVCTLTYACDVSLKKHMITAHGLPGDNVVLFDGRCELCDKEFPTKKAFVQHQYSVHNVSLKCPICDARLKSKRSLEYHLRGHSGEKPYECRYCDLSFKATEPRNLHERRKHTGERPYKCKFCGKAFMGITTLCQHQDLHMKEKNCKCDFCPYKTHRPAALRIHIRVHTGEKPYTCTVCGKSYKASWDLKQHSALHTGGPVRRRVRRNAKTRDSHEAGEISPPQEEESGSTSASFPEAVDFP